MTTYTDPTGNVSGTDSDDTFIFDSTPTAAVNVFGRGGVDTLVYNTGSATALHVTLHGSSGDQLDGTIAPSLNFTQFENFTLTGGSGNDYVQISGDYSGSGLSVDGAGGTDWLNIDFGVSSNPLNFVVAADGTVSSNIGHFANFETYSFNGGSGADIFVAGGGNDRLVGGNGADYLDGGAGSDSLVAGPNQLIDDAPDTLIGGAGDDRISAGYGDTIDGGTGNDILDYDASNGTAGIVADFLTLTNGGTITIAGATLKGVERVNSIHGTNFSDTIIAGESDAAGVQLNGLAGDDDLTGGNLTDRIFGGDGNDVIRGGGGNDTISGDNGNDVLSGGAGVDTLGGGAGTDTFRDTAAGFNGDTIVDLAADERVIITDANLSNFSASLSGNVVTYTGGQFTLSSHLPGTIAVSAAAGGGVQLQLKPVPVATNDQIAQQLTTGFWNGDTHKWAVTQGGTLTVNLGSLNSTEQSLARAALAGWSDIIGVHLQEVLSGGQIVFDNSADPSGPVAATDAAWSGGIMTYAHVHISSSWLSAFGSSFNSYGYQTYVHEVGHALGLGHPGDYNQDATYTNDALFLNDSWATSVLSYFDQDENAYFNNLNFTRTYAVTPMQADIVAMQSLYGLSTTTRSGDTVYGYHSNAGGVYDAGSFGGVALTIFDSGGNDTLDYSSTYASQLINLNPETFSNVNGSVGNLAIGRGTTIENAIGGNGTDTIIGNAIDNVLTGNTGSDTLTGGAGNDTFLDTAAGHNGDTITDFSAGDSIVFTDASAGSFTFSLTGNVLNYTGGSLTLGSIPVGTIIANAAAGGGVQLIVEPNQASNDFDGDGRSDILWRDDSGQFTDWLGTADGGFTPNSANAYAQVPTSWHIAGTGDFDGDHRVDILWRNDDGTVTDWLANANGGFAPSTAFSVQVANAWHIAGTGDFNGDGKDDILWRDDSGQLTNWLANGSGGFAASSVFSSYVPTDWHVVATGDFNGDGKDDILWRSDSGQLTDWLGSGDGSLSASSSFSTYVPVDWQVAGTGDFNGDGYDDILWRNNDGQMTNWLGDSSGGFTANGANAATYVPTSWQVAQVGDFNGDGKDDILWRDDSGHTTNWLGTGAGAFVPNGANFSISVDTSWHVENPLL